MESFLGFVESLPDWHGLAVLLICLIVFTLIESAAPLFSAGYPRFKHAGINLGLLAINTLVVAPLSVVLVILALWVDANAFEIGRAHV